MKRRETPYTRMMCRSVSEAIGGCFPATVALSNRRGAALEPATPFAARSASAPHAAAVTGAKLPAMQARARTALPLALVALSTAGVLAQQPTFRSGTQTVPLYVTVTDAQGRLVPDLTKEDFQVLDNTKPQELTLFDNSVRPITAVVMLDTSGSMTMNLEFVKQAAEQFVIRLLPDDKAKVGAFNDKIEFANAAFTSDRDELAASIKELDFGNATRLWDAVDASLEELKDVEGRRVVVVFTDGDDQGSRVGLGRVIDRARADEAMVYAIGLESIMQPGGVGRVIRTRPDGGLKRLAEETGGGYFELKKTEELGPAFTRVAQELHSQYVLGFTPQLLDNKVHRLDVKTTNPSFKARARRSYVAAPPDGGDAKSTKEDE
jgi:Ca-activated chloride channel family protein